MINLYILGEKGYFSLISIQSNFLSLINFVVVGRDKNILNDYSAEIIEYCELNNLNYFVQNKVIEHSKVTYNIAIGWRWLIKDGIKLIVFHDSLLPRLKGFNPLVTSLINGDKEIGVTVLFGADDFDSGDIIIQKKIKINYPIKIKQASEKISILCAEAINELLYQITSGVIKSLSQDESLSTFSLWRDEEDYLIDWTKSSLEIVRFIDSVGYPYKGAFTTWKNRKYFIKDALIASDVIIENRSPGKILFKKENCFFVVCGTGLLCISEFFDENGEKIELPNFRVRFK
jgi:methionyl-tRNA formyltransferase